jgi:quinol monooxygenase YgiN
MQRFLSAVLFGLACVMMASGARADVKLANGHVLSAKPYFIITYVEAAPRQANKAAALIRAQRDASKADPGNLRFETLRRIGEKNHFMILEAWTDQAARDAHAKASHTVDFRKKLQPFLYSPYDERPHVGLVAADPAKTPQGSKRTVYVVTHVDIIPTEQFSPCKRQVDAAGPCGNAMVEKLVADSRKEKGNIRFDALTQASRPNHMAIIEMWKTPKAQKAHLTAAGTTAFRDELSGIKPGSGVNADPLFVPNPLSGSLYDERMYKLMK